MATNNVPIGTPMMIPTLISGEFVRSDVFWVLAAEEFEGEAVETAFQPSIAIALTCIGLSSVVVFIEVGVPEPLGYVRIMPCGMSETQP